MKRKIVHKKKNWNGLYGVWMSYCGHYLHTPETDDDKELYELSNWLWNKTTCRRCLRMKNK